MSRQTSHNLKNLRNSKFYADSLSPWNLKRQKSIREKLFWWLATFYSRHPQARTRWTQKKYRWKEWTNMNDNKSTDHSNMHKQIHACALTVIWVCSRANQMNPRTEENQKQEQPEVLARHVSATCRSFSKGKTLHLPIHHHLNARRSDPISKQVTKGLVQDWYVAISLALPKSKKSAFQEVVGFVENPVKGYVVQSQQERREE